MASVLGLTPTKRQALQFGRPIGWQVMLTPVRHDPTRFLAMWFGFAKVCSFGGSWGGHISTNAVLWLKKLPSLGL